MKLNAIFKRQNSFLFIVMGLLSVSSCDSTKETVKKLPKKAVEVAKETILLAPEDERQFYHAWLADCVNDMNKEDFYKPWAVDVLKDSTRNRINRATGNSSIALRMGHEKLVWGPELVAEDAGDLDYININLMYCVKYTVAGRTTYSVGISGTNMISKYDWFTEDLMVGGDTVYSPIAGKISIGTGRGLTKLLNMKSNGKTLNQFLAKEVNGNLNSRVVVAGHSLGGALTQAYSAYLSKSLTRSLKAKVEAYVYAGPTAGDEAFAKGLTETVTYNAYNNKYDLVPHTWQADKLKELCSLYEGKTICGNPIKENSVVSAMVKYLRAISSPIKYTMPGTETVFIEKIPKMSPGSCKELNILLDGLYIVGSTTDIYYHMNKIKEYCNSTGTHISKEDFKVFFYYLVEMGEQHTTAYFNHFFNGESNEFKNAVKSSVPVGAGNINSLFNGDSGKNILEQFLARIEGYLQSQPTKDCNCAN